MNMSPVIPSAGRRSFLPDFLFCLLSVFLFAASAAQAQTADEVVARYVSALGGKEKIQSIQSVYQEGTAIMQNGMEIDSKTWKVQGKLYRTEISFGTGSVVVIVTPDKGWTSNPRDGGAFKEMTPAQVKNLQWQLDCAGPLVDYAAKGNKVELLGSDTANGSDCYALKLTLASGEYIKYSIDKKTGYVLREARQGGGMARNSGTAPKTNDRDVTFSELRIEYSDYQKTPDGYTFPFTIVAGSFRAKNSVTKLDVNKPVDIAALSKPTN
jgi:outer membrane lipoprotein-sorting protein